MSRVRRWLKRWALTAWIVVRREVTPLRVWLAVFTALVTYGLYEVRELADQNRQRIVDVQESRITSCRQTYEGVREVFQPFFPPKKGRTMEQQANLDKFNSTIDGLKAKCDQQTTTEEP